jgi:hypothetical protein
MMSSPRAYPASVYSEDAKGEYDDAFDEAQADCADGFIRNDYGAGSPGYLGYEAGIKTFEPLRENWEAQASYDARWYGH